MCISRSSSRRINSQHLHELSHFFQVSQGVARRLVVTAQKVHVKNVFPRPSPHGAGLDLAQADIAQGKHAERLEERARNILYLKHDGGLVRAARNEATIVRTSLLFLRGPASYSAQIANQEEAREVSFVIFDAGLENAPSVFSCRLTSRDSCGIVQLSGNDVFHAAGRVIERNRLDLRMLAKKIAALVERNRMRQHTP